MRLSSHIPRHQTSLPQARAARPVIAIALAVALGTLVLAQSDEADRVRAATEVLSEALAIPERAIPRAVLEKAEAVAVLPGVKKGGFVVGGQWGRGVLSGRSRASNTWSSPAFLTLTSGSVGLQIGGQETDLSSSRDIVIERYGGAPDPVPAWRDLLSRATQP